MAGLSNVTPQFEALREAMLRERPPTLGPDQGDEAFRQHKLLATIIHRAAGLDAKGSESETRAWARYFTEHFPPPRNVAVDAELLWTEWRTALLKKDAPGLNITVTHGKPQLHWQRDDRGRLCIDLESMWDDYVQSVDHFIRYLEATPERCQVALQRWQEKGTWVVETVNISSLTVRCQVPRQWRPRRSGRAKRSSPRTHLARLERQRTAGDRDACLLAQSRSPATCSKGRDLPG